MANLLETPLCAWHREHGAKMGEFSGWDMPIQYTGILQEHQHTRTTASIFDICHMGQILISGQDAAHALGLAVTHNLETLQIGKCRYGFLLNEHGGVIDDLIVYRFEAEQFLLVVNASRTLDDYVVLTNLVGGHNVSNTRKVENISDSMGKIDLQGQASLDILEKISKENFHNLGYFSFRHITFQGTPLLVSRTGYTGELGYELYPQRHMVLPLWETLLADDRVKPAGLGARDTLRLEAGLPLYGHELDTEHTPAESGLGGMLTSQQNYIGSLYASEVKKQLLVPLCLEGRRTARNGDVVLVPETDQVIGKVTSGSFAPSLGYSIAFAFVDKMWADNENFTLKSGNALLPAKKTAIPFYRAGTARIKLA